MTDAEQIKELSAMLDRAEQHLNQVLDGVYAGTGSTKYALINDKEVAAINCTLEEIEQLQLRLTLNQTIKG